MVRDADDLINSTTTKGKIQTAGSEQLLVKAIGDAALKVGSATIKLKNVLHVPKLNTNLVSVIALVEEGARVILEETGAIIILNGGTAVKCPTNRKKKQWELHGEALITRYEDVLEGVDDNLQDNEEQATQKDKVSLLWHERFGHPGRDKTAKIQQHYMGNDTKILHESADCDNCSQAKQTRARMGKSTTEPATAPLELVHIDLMTDLRGHPNYHYALVILDDASSYLHVEPLGQKSEVIQADNSMAVRLGTGEGEPECIAG